MAALHAPRKLKRGTIIAKVANAPPENIRINADDDEM